MIWRRCALLLITALATQPSPGATLAFYNGVLANVGTDSNCITSFSETREQAYDGFTLRNGTLTPHIGERWYAHVVISHPGDPCSGGSETGIEILLPPSTTFAIDADDPVYCAVRNISDQVSIYTDRRRAVRRRRRPASRAIRFRPTTT